MLVYHLFTVGLVFLVKGADFLVDGASAIAKKLKVSDIVIGLPIVAFGTSPPALVVNLFASSRDGKETFWSAPKVCFLLLYISDIFWSQSCGDDEISALSQRWSY